MKPREKLLVSGVSSLSDNELLCLILSSGNKNNSVYNISTNLINSINGIENLIDISINDLTKINGIGLIKAINIIASVELGKRIVLTKPKIKETLNNQDIVFKYFKYIFNREKQEKFLAIYLDSKKRLISYKILFIGTLDKTIVHQREIFYDAIKEHASSIIVMHNHPSGILTPSKEDLEFTNKIVASGKMMQIPLIDHLITDGNHYFSFWENNLINNFNIDK